MASRQFKLPVARVLPVAPVVGLGLGPEDGRFDAANILSHERLLLVDLEALHLTKSFAKLKAQAATWDDAACEEYLLGIMAQGPV